MMYKYDALRLTTTMLQGFRLAVEPLWLPSTPAAFRRCLARFLLVDQGLD